MDRTTEQHVEEFIRELIARGVAAQDELVGCTQEEIEQVRVDQGVTRLPPVYAAFLQRMGRGAGRLLRGTDAFYPSILGLKRDARDLLAENAASYTLPGDSLVLAMHQGYMFFFFPSIQTDDPPVLTYIEGEDRPQEREERTGVRVHWPNLMAWLEVELDASSNR